MNRSSSILVAVLLGVAVAPLPGTTAASASCAGPALEVERLTLRPGSRVTVEGRGFVDGCRDSMSCSTGWGCSSCEYDEPPPVPFDELDLRLVQGDRAWTLDTVDAGQNGTVSWTFTVPAGVRPGAARLAPDEAQTVRVRVR